MDTDRVPVPVITPQQLAARLGRPGAPMLLDVRREARFVQSGHMLAGAVRCPPEEVAAFARAHAACEVVVYCVYGHEVGADAAAALRSAGWPAAMLAGGIEGGEDGVDTPEDIARWRAVTLPAMPRPGAGQ